MKGPKRVWVLKENFFLLHIY